MTEVTFQPVMEGGDLWSQIFERNPQGVHPLQAKHIMAQLVSTLGKFGFMAVSNNCLQVYGLNEMHKVGLLHRDIKPDNVLLDTEGRVYFADFGLSHVFTKTPPEQYSLAPEYREADVTHKMCGTLGYMAPEVILGQEYSYSADTFSLGALMKELVEGYSPFSGVDENEKIYRTLYENPAMPISPDFDVVPFHLASMVCV